MNKFIIYDSIDSCYEKQKSANRNIYCKTITDFDLNKY